MAKWDVLNKNYEYFQKQLPELMKKHLSEFVLIKDEKVIKIFATVEEADKFVTEQKYPPGSFLIQEIDNTIHYVSRLA